MYQDLVDNVFFVAPGRWTMYQCAQCESAYLDPRPNEASIGKAYGTYYTHTASGGARLASSDLGWARSLQRRLANGYLNHWHGTRRVPASRVGIAFLKLFPLSRQILDVEFRYLPAPSAGQNLLDIGCGNGSFLSSAHEAGWVVTGIDPDPQAVATAKELGFDVRLGSIDLLDGVSSRFDVITLSHVIEHVHEPKKVIQAVHRLLKPGGVLYIDTPNIESKGAARFGRSWRGLETPRHLVLFSSGGIVGLLNACGFGRIELKHRVDVRQSMYLSSLRIQSGLSPYGAVPAKLPLLMRLRLKFRLANARREEFLTLVAWKAES